MNFLSKCSSWNKLCIHVILILFTACLCTVVYCFSFCLYVACMCTRVRCSRAAVLRPSRAILWRAVWATSWKHWATCLSRSRQVSLTILYLLKDIVIFECTLVSILLSYVRVLLVLVYPCFVTMELVVILVGYGLALLCLSYNCSWIWLIEFINRHFIMVIG